VGVAGRFRAARAIRKQEAHMKNRPWPYIARGRLAITAFTLFGAFLLHPDLASAQGCGGGPLSTSKGNLIGSAVGGAAGGLIGNQFGSGAGKGVMTGLGVVGGALAGGYAGRSMEGCGHAAQRTAPQSASHASRRAAAAPARAASERRTCRSVISQAVIDGREQQVEGVACLDADGVWRTASGPAAEQAAAADLVLRAQQRLREQGFYVRDNVDGRWGPATDSALRSFQRANGMASTGQLDVPTRTALGLDAAPLAEPGAQSGQPVQAGAEQRAATPGAAAPSSVGQ
jgi:surface antigen